MRILKERRDTWTFSYAYFEGMVLLAKDTKGAIRNCISDNTMTKIYQRDNRKLYIRQHNNQKTPKGKLESVYQTTQWPKDTKGAIRIIFWSLCCLIYGFWLPLWYLLVIVLSDIRILIAPLVSFGHCVVWSTDSDNTITKRYQKGNQNLYIRQHNDQKIPKE
jgi:hypothetical protein